MRPCLGFGIPGHLVAGGMYTLASVQVSRSSATRSDCMRIHAGTLGTLPREVGRSLGGFDQVFLPGKKSLGMVTLVWRVAWLNKTIEGFH